MNFSEGMTSKDKIDFLERYILVHSFLYYSKDISVISDKRFDKYARLLADKIKHYGPKRIASTQYGYAFQDFDGNTGFDLIDRLNREDRKHIECVATSVLRLYRKEGKR